MSSFLNRRSVTLGAVALAVTIGAGVSLSGQAHAAGLPNYPRELACYQNFGSKNDRRLHIKDPVRVGDRVKYTVIPEFWLLGRYQQLKQNPAYSLSVAYQDAHFDAVWVCRAVSNQTGGYWPYDEVISWGG